MVVFQWLWLLVDVVVSGCVSVVVGVSVAIFRIEFQMFDGNRSRIHRCKHLVRANILFMLTPCSCEHLVHVNTLFVRTFCSC